MDSTSIPFRSHTALLLAAALPYLQTAYRHPAELALKFLELSETMKFYREFHLQNTDPQSPLHKNTNSQSGEAGIFELISRFILDPEGLLNNLSTVCSGKEKEIVSMLLNLIRAKNFYENYGDMLSMFMSTEPAPGDTGDFSSMLNKEQSDTLNLLKNLLDAD